MEEDEDKEFLLDGISNGFRLIEKNSSITPVQRQNHKSAIENFNDTDALIKKEIQKGNYVFTDNKPDIVSPLGLVPKSSGGFRLIHDCSAPNGKSLNDYAPSFEKYHYQSVDDVVELAEPGYYMAKVDIKSAYRHVSIHKDSQKVTGLSWIIDGKETYLYDNKLPFGARASPTIFHRLTQSVKRMMIRRGYEGIVVYQDDFLVMGETEQKCMECWTTLIDLLHNLGFELAKDKLEAPTTCITFLGIQIDSIRMELSLPNDKLQNIQNVVNQFLNKKRATKRQLQTLAGKLNFAARVVRGGRTFLRRILDVMNKLKKSTHKVRIQGEIKEDIAWWSKYLEGFNGVVKWIKTGNVSTVVTDACGMAGGAFCNGDFVYTVWSVDCPEAADLPINYKEALMAAKAAIRWAPLYRNHVMNVFTDNQCAATIINKCTARNSVVMTTLREMFWVATQCNVSVVATYWPGEKNITADLASRLHERSNLSKFALEYERWSQSYSSGSVHFDTVSMLNHMSLKSLMFILDQVLSWRKHIWH